MVISVLIVERQKFRKLDMALKYTAWAYRDGKPYKMTYVLADSKEQAISEAWAKFIQLGVQFDYVQVN